MLRAFKAGNRPNRMLLPFAINVATIKFNSKDQVLFRTNRVFGFVTTCGSNLNICFGDTSKRHMPYAHAPQKVSFSSYGAKTYLAPSFHDSAVRS